MRPGRLVAEGVDGPPAVVLGVDAVRHGPGPRRVAARGPGGRPPAGPIRPAGAADCKRPVVA